MAVTIKTVAKKAGVSIATVSRVINHNGYISETAKTKVIKAVKETGYLIKHKNNYNKNSNLDLVKILIPTLENPFYAEFFQKTSTALSQQGYLPIPIINKNYDLNFKFYINQIKNKKISGLIVSSPLISSPNSDLSHLPIITFDKKISNATEVKSNDLDGGFKIAERVLSLGRKNILIISGNKNDLYPINDRIKGMLTVFNRYKISVRTAYVDFTSSLIARKIQIAQLIGHSSYDAICCTDDITALMVQQYTQKSGLFPTITGFDGTYLIRDLSTKLITVQQPIQDIANFIVEILVKKIKHPSKTFEPKYIFPVRLIN